jgi:hypothetical protein
VKFVKVCALVGEMMAAAAGPLICVQVEVTGFPTGNPSSFMLALRKTWAGLVRDTWFGPALTVGG